MQTLKAMVFGIVALVGIFFCMTLLPVYVVLIGAGIFFFGLPGALTILAIEIAIRRYADYGVWVVISYIVSFLVSCGTSYLLFGWENGWILAAHLAFTVLGGAAMGSCSVRLLEFIHTTFLGVDLMRMETYRSLRLLDMEMERRWSVINGL